MSGQTFKANSPSIELFDLPVEGGKLRVSRIGQGKHPVLGLHGLAGSRVTIEPASRFLGEDFSFYAPDLRGRGLSAELPGPYSIEVHARDCAQLLDQLGLKDVVVVGHSMGAMVTARLAARRPDLVRAIVLMDGGLPAEVPVPAGMKIEDLMQMLIGPVLANVIQTFPTEDAYLAQWRVHPAWGGTWNDDIEARFRYEMGGQAPNIRSRTSAEALKGDMTDAFGNMPAAIEAFKTLRCPIHVFRAPRGLLDQPAPALSDDLVARWKAELPQLIDTMVADTNHVTLGALDHSLNLIGDAIKQFSS